MLFASTKVALFTSGALALVYFVLLRRWIRSRLTAAQQPSNVDAFLGRTGVVTVRITALEAGQVKVGDETWRAVLAPGSTGARGARAGRDDHGGIDLRSDVDGEVRR